MKLEGFDILEQLGHGGMATVYRARQVSLDREVAIKVFAPDFEPTPEDRESFQNEARMAARLKHPGLVQVYDAIFSGDTYCFVMELIRGYTVAAWGQRKGHLDEDSLLSVADAVADALDYAWRLQGVIHCDIKPENIMVDEDGTVKVLDLGLAKTAQAMRHKGTDDQVYGTPQYISPEQAIGQSDLDCRTDIYALGASLYQLATGRPLFPDVTDAEAMERQVRGRAPNPRTLNPDLSPAFASLLEKMLAKDRDRRQRDWETVRADIATVRLGHPLASGNPVPNASTVESGPAPEQPQPVDNPRIGRLGRSPAKESAAATTKPAPGPRITVPREGIRPTARKTSHNKAAPIVKGLLFLAIIAAIAVAVLRNVRAREEAQAAERDLAAARQALACIPENPTDLVAFDHAEELLQAAGKHTVNLAVVNDALSRLATRRSQLEEVLRKRAVDDLLASAETLAASGKADQAVARLLEYAGPGREESAARRKAAADAILARQRRREEDERRRAEADARWREASAAREEAARRQTAVETQLLDILETSGLAAAADLAEQKASSEPALFSPGTRCGWLRTFLRDAAATQEAFDKSLHPEGLLTIRLRSGTTLSGRVLHSRNEGELRLAVRASGGIDLDQTIRLQDLHPQEILRRTGTSETPGARFVRARLTVLCDLPRPTPRHLETLCRGFPPRLRDLALAPRRQNTTPSQPQTTP